MHRAHLAWLILTLMAAWRPQETMRAADEPPPLAAFDPDPGHSWNRLYGALPISNADSKIFLNGSPISDAGRAGLKASLAGFLEDGAAVERMSSLKKAVMQRQLLLQFHLNSAAGQNGQPAAGPDHDEILNGLARAAKRIALSAAEIRQLPDTYATALSAPGVVTEFDPAHPAPFLPKDLLIEDGPWIGLRLTAHGGRQGVVADFHFRSILRGSTSFEVRMRHPEGRAAGVAYLKSLADMVEPLLKEGTLETARLSQTEFPNPATPQFPAGTAWALVHRAILVDPDGQPVVSPLVEGLQVRVYRMVSLQDVWKSEDFQAEIKALEDSKQEYEYDRVSALRYQTAFEWTMHGAKLLDREKFHLSRPQDTLFGEGRTENIPVTAFCMQCHSASGIHSVNSRAGLFREKKLTRSPEFEAATRQEIDAVTTEAARALSGWTELLKRWNSG